jgi:uncharacterized protein YhdP
MPRWLRLLLIWKGHLLLWSAALVAVAWVALVLFLQLLASRPETLQTLASWADARLEMKQFSSEARPLSSSVSIRVEGLALAWQGGQLEVPSLSADVHLWNLLWPDLAVGKQMRAASPVLTLSALDAGVGGNPLASPWLRLWEDTLISQAKVVWQAEEAWTLQNIDMRMNMHENWSVHMVANLYYPNFPMIPISADANIRHRFGFNPSVHFSARALPEGLHLFGQSGDVQFRLQGDWTREQLSSILLVEVRDTEAWTQGVSHQLVGRVVSDDLRTWDITIERLVLAEQSIELPVWPRLSLHPQTGALLTLNKIRLSETDQWLALLPQEWQAWWVRWKPQLWLNQLSLHWRADGQLDDIRGAIDQLSWQSNEAVPGMTFRQLTFDYAPEQKRLAIVPQGDSDIRWHQQDGELLKVEADPLVLQVDPANVFARWSLPSWRVNIAGVEANLMMHVHETEATQLQLTVKADTLQQVLPLLPLRLTSQELQNWLASSKLNGSQAKANFKFNGALTDLLTGNLHVENFSAQVEAQQVRLIYDLDYPPINQADILLTWFPDRLAITAERASLLGAQLNQVKADILYQQERVALRINGLVKGELPQITQFLQQSPLANELEINELLSELRLTGGFNGQLSLWLPLQGYDDKVSTRVRGVIHTQKAQLHYRDETVHDLKTRLLVSEMGVEARSISGTWREGPIQARLTSDSSEQQRLLLTAQTPLAMQEIAQGMLPWRAEVKFLPNELMQFQASADVNQIKLSAPFANLFSTSDDAIWQVKGVWQQDQLKLSAQDKQWQLHTQWLNSVTDWRLVNLSLLPLKTTQTPAKQSIKLVLPKVNGDMWLSWWERYQANTASVGVDLTERGHISMTQFDLMGQSFHAVNLDWQKGQENTGWLKINSPEVNGALNWQGEDMKLHLSNLLFKHHILSVAEKKAEGAPQCRTPSSSVWPSLSVSIDKLLLETWRESRIVTSELTNIKAQIKQQGSVRSAKDIEFRSKTLAAKLDWDWDVASQRSSLFINARAEQAIDLTRLVGIDNAINSGSIELSSLQSWQGGLDCYDSRLISGSLDMRADDGVLSEASPGGFSRLLGLLSFDAFTRRLKMGLGDVVNQGLAFDKILLKSTLNKGVLQVESLAVTSSAMNIDLSGSSSINNETHNLQAKVTPLIGDTIPTMALLSGASPITAIGYYLLQKIIPPLGGNFITLNYRITGSWQEPILDETSAP